VIITVVFFNNLGKLLALRIWIRPLQAVSISKCMSVICGEFLPADENLVAHVTSDYLRLYGQANKRIRWMPRR
jgi:hypothetical protein